MGKFRIGKKEYSNFTTPQEMYDDYKNRKIEGIHDYQSKMIDQYMENKDKSNDIALELPTGTGKTLIGLLIGEFRRKKYNEKVLYLCPNNQLVNQTVEQARKNYGIKALGFTGSSKNYPPNNKIDYITNQSIAVTNYSSLFNTNSFFKDPNIIIFDDAHSGENYISSNWSVTIDRSNDTDLYYIIIDVIKNLIEDVIYNKLINDDPSPNDKSWFDKIPNLKLYSKYAYLQTTIDNYIKKTDTKIRFPWSNIREHLFACNIFLSWKELVIRPFIPPTLSHKPFSKAKQRIYMSATPGKSGELERSFGVPSIHRLPMVKDWENRTIGRKYFMFPLASFDIKDTDVIIERIAEITTRTLMIVKDNHTKNKFQKVLEENTDVKIFSSQDIEKSKNAFTSSDKGFALIANRFDGIDFPNDECRMLILFDLPNATHLQEKFLITRMAAITLFEERINTRLVQSLGRCTRSNTDYAAVCIFGDELTSSLLSPSKLKQFNPELHSELLFGQENSVDQDNIENYLGLLDTFLNDRDEWADAEQYIINRRDEIIRENLKPDNTDYDNLKNSCINEVQAQYSMWKEDYTEALKNIDSIIYKLDSDSLKGYRGFWYYVGAYCAYNLFKNGNKLYEEVYKNYIKKASKSTISINWFKKIIEDEAEFQHQSNQMEYLIENIEKTILKFSKVSINKFYDELKHMLDLLNDSDSNFEKGHELLGGLLGYRTFNPKGDGDPDPIWILNDKFCIVAEDKIYDSPDKKIPARHVRQAGSHVNWIKNHADTLSINKEATCITTFITNSNQIDESASIHGDNVYYLNREDLVEFAVKCINVLKEARRTFNCVGELTWRESLVNSFIKHEITPNDYIKLVKTKKLSQLN